MDDRHTQKRPHLNDTVADNFSNKKPKPLNDAVDPSFDGDELFKLLDTPPCPLPCPVKFVAYPYTAPPVAYSTSFVTINGNDETCGSSFSDTDSSIMAGFNTVTVNVSDLWGVACGGAWGEIVCEVARGDTNVSGGEWDWNELLFGEQVMDKHQTAN